jgi:outer membrane protein TolC
MTATNLCRVGIALALAGCASFSAFAQDASSPYQALRTAFEAPLAEELPGSASASTNGVASGSYHLTLEEARSRVLQTSVIMDLASTQVQAKCYALQAARKDYLPKVLNAFTYFHFDSDLGKVLTTPGVFNPATTVSVPVFEQDSLFYTATAIQPITPLLKVRELVKVSAAEVRTAQAQVDDARGQLLKGVEELYFGILAAQRSRAILEQALAAARQMAAAAPSPLAQISVVETQQGLLTAEQQVVTLIEQMNSLIDLPAQTQLELEEPPSPTNPFASADDAVAAAVASSPKLREAQEQVNMAEAALRVAKADYVPSVLAYGFYANNNSLAVIQEDFTGVGMSATYTLEWGQKNDALRGAKATLCLARQNLRKVIQDTSLAAVNAFHTATQAEQALSYAQQLAKLNQEVQPTAQEAQDPLVLKAAAAAKLQAVLGAIKAEVDYRIAVIELKSMTGRAE